MPARLEVQFGYRSHDGFFQFQQTGIVGRELFALLKALKGYVECLYQCGASERHYVKIRHNNSECNSGNAGWLRRPHEATAICCLAKLLSVGIRLFAGERLPQRKPHWDLGAVRKSAMMSGPEEAIGPKRTARLLRIANDAAEIEKTNGVWKRLLPLGLRYGVLLPTLGGTGYEVAKHIAGEYSGELILHRQNSRCRHLLQLSVAELIVVPAVRTRDTCDPIWITHHIACQRRTNREPLLAPFSFTKARPPDLSHRRNRDHHRL